MSGADLRLGIVISGRGGNMLAIARSCADKKIGAQVAVVVADRHEAGGIRSARELGLTTAVVPVRECKDRDEFEAQLERVLNASEAQLIILAGFMRILSSEFTARFAGRMLNIHPSLLPKYPGLRTHERAIQAGDATAGCSVHLVTGDLDAGPLIAQARVPVLAGDTPATLSARVQQQEHILYPLVIGWIAAGRLQLDGDTPALDGRPLLEPVIAA